MESINPCETCRMKEAGDCDTCRIAALEAECERLRAAREDERELADNLGQRLAAAEAALAEAREEDERRKRSMDNRREMRWVDMTPDAGLVARILSAYIDNTSCTDNLAGLDPESFICKMMDEHTAQRNVLINSAIDALRSRADDAGRVERVIAILRDRDGAVMDYGEEYDYREVARAVLAAADGKEDGE